MYLTAIQFAIHFNVAIDFCGDGQGGLDVQEALEEILYVLMVKRPEPLLQRKFPVVLYLIYFWHGGGAISPQSINYSFFKKVYKILVL